MPVLVMPVVVKSKAVVASLGPAWPHKTLTIAWEVIQKSMFEAVR